MLTDECTTKDGVLVYAATEVFAISPWADVFALYVDITPTSASTSAIPEEISGGPASCMYPTSECYASEATASAAALTYVEDDEGFWHPPYSKE